MIKKYNQICSPLKYFVKIVRLLLATMSVNGLKPGQGSILLVTNGIIVSRCQSVQTIQYKLRVKISYRIYNTLIFVFPPRHCNTLR